MVMDIGHRGPSSPADFRWPEESVLVEALARAIRPEQIDAALAIPGRKKRRLRRLPPSAVVWLVICFGVWGQDNIPTIWRRLGGTLRALLGALDGLRPPVKSALSQARQRLGAAPMHRLFRMVAGPMATQQTVGAFYKGMRIRAIDGVHLDVVDTPANAVAFGRPSTTRNGEAVAGGYPAVLVVYLCETGTHAIQDLVIRPCNSSERPSARHLLTEVPSGDLLLWDSGFYGYKLLAQAMDQGVHVLGPVPSGVLTRPIKRLWDGSYLAKIYPSKYARQKDRDGLIVRILEYTFDDPNRPGHGERHRLATTLLDEKQCPATELICLYHERWEIEIANDELKTHQLARLVDLRSRTPGGVRQEIYGILLAYNAARALMHEAALAEQIDPRRLSFLDSLRIIRDTVADMRNACVEKLPVLYRGLLKLIGHCRLPPREGRINPRVIKRKMSKWLKKRPQHYRPPQPEKPFDKAVVMLN
jgi:hypothetical protein